MKAGNSRGKQRWSHNTARERKVCPWHGLEPIYPPGSESAGIDQQATERYRKQIAADKRGVRRYVVTAAQNATPVHAAFLQSLLTYCKVNNAQLIVIPYRYKNPTSIWSEKAKDDDWWAPELAKYLLDKRIELNRHLVILGDIKTQPTSSQPLAGFETITGGRSAVIGHPRLELTTVATPQAKLPKILTTTGAITQRNYLPTKAGKQAEHHHTFGAAVLEVKGDVFHLRQLNALSNGSFTDLDREYRGEKVQQAEPAAALVMGDTHQEFVDPAVVRGTFGKRGLVARVKPKVLVWHDVHDFYARNHHHRGEVFTNYAKHHAGAGNVADALQATFAFIDKHTPPGVLSVIVPSNHPDALARWVKEADPKTDPENALFWAETFVAMCQGAKMTDTGATTIDPFEYWGRQMMLNGDVRFLRRDESFQVAGIELGYHGDRGSNGARGSLKSFTKIGVKTVTGHRHAPGIIGGAYCTGTNSRLRLEYNSGPSGWLHTDCLVYANGKRTLINFIDGEWCA